MFFDNNTVPPIFQHVRNSIVLSSFSKDLSLPGERIGYLALHPDADDKKAIIDAMTLATRILGFVNAPAFMQRVVAGLQDASIDDSIYRRRRDTFCAILTAAGFEFEPPKGAFYVFPKAPIDDGRAVLLPAAGRKKYWLFRGGVSGRQGTSGWRSV